MMLNNSRKNIELKSKHTGAILWLTGLSGSGKSTIALEVEKNFLNRGYNVIILDGDILRLGLNNDLGFTITDRNENIRRASEVAALFYSAGFIIICAFISPIRTARSFARNLVPEGHFFEIYVKCSLEECIRRDPKELYKQAIGNCLPEFTGISSPYEYPLDPELILDTEKISKDHSYSLIEEMLKLSKILF